MHTKNPVRGLLKQRDGWGLLGAIGGHHDSKKDYDSEWVHGTTESSMHAKNLHWMKVVNIEGKVP